MRSLISQKTDVGPNDKKQKKGWQSSILELTAPRSCIASGNDITKEISQKQLLLEIMETLDSRSKFSEREQRIKERIRHTTSRDEIRALGVEVIELLCRQFGEEKAFSVAQHVIQGRRKNMRSIKLRSENLAKAGSASKHPGNRAHTRAWTIRTVTAFLLLSSLWGPNASARDLEEIYRSGNIIIAHRDQSPPLSYTLPSGKPAGMAVEICQRLAIELSKMDGRVLRPKYKVVTASNRIEVIEAGAADLECGSTTNNAQRRKRVSFTVPHYITGARLLVRTNSNLVSIGDSNIKTVASTIGTTPLARLKELKSTNGYRFEIVEVSDHRKGVEGVRNGSFDGFVMDEVLLAGLAGKSIGENLSIVGKYLTIEPLAIMMNKNSVNLKDAVDRAMKRMIVAGDFHAIYSTWFQSPIPPDGVNLGIRLNYLTRDLWRFPTANMP